MEILVGLLYAMLYTLGGLSGALVALLVLPVSIRVAVCGRPAGDAPAVEGAVSVWLGLLGVAAAGRGSRWELRPRLLGRALPGPVLRLGSGSGARSKPSPEPDRRAEDDGATTEAGALAEEAAGEAEGPVEGPVRRVRDAVKRVCRILDLVGPPGLSLVRSLPRVLHVRRGVVTGRFGFADPGQTGLVFGCLQALSAHRWRRLKVRLAPDWLGQEMDVKGEVLLHFYLGLLLVYAARCAAQMAWRWIGLRIAALTWLPGTAR